MKARTYTKKASHPHRGGSMQKVFCKEEAFMEAILQHLLSKDVEFDIVGKQALLVDKQYAEDLQRLFGSDEVALVSEFPPECIEKGGVESRRSTSVPDRFVPVQVPEQKKY